MGTELHDQNSLFLLSTLKKIHEWMNYWSYEFSLNWIVHAWGPWWFCSEIHECCLTSKFVPAQSIVLENLVNFNTHTACLGLYRRFMIGFHWLVCSSSSSRYTRTSLYQTSASVDVLLRCGRRPPKRKYLPLPTSPYHAATIANLASDTIWYMIITLVR